MKGFPGNIGRPNPIRMSKQGLAIDPNKLPGVICGKCDCSLFLKAARIKKLSKLHPSNQSPVHQSINMEFWVCSNCGEALVFNGPKENYKEVPVPSDEKAGTEEVSDEKPKAE